MHRSILRKLKVGVFLLSLSACENQHTQIRVPSTIIKSAPVEKIQQTKLIPPVVNPPQIKKIEDKPVRPDKSAVLPKVLVGLTSTKILTIFGLPVFVRKDPPAEFWRYQSQLCNLEVFFYLKNGGLRVDHISTISNGETRTKRSQCIKLFQRHG